MPSPARLLKDVVAGCVVSLVAISFYMSSATLMFQGPLAQHLQLAIGSAFFGGVLLSLLAAFKGSQPLAALGPEPATVPVLASIVAGVIATASPQAVLPTAVVSLSVTALAIGVAWWAIGHRGAGNLIRFIPYPVIGGFLSSVGWLLFSGGLGVSMGRPLSATMLFEPFDIGLMARLAAGLGIGVLLWWTTMRIKHVLFLPGMLLLVCVAIHAGLWAQGIDTDTARAQGWLMANFGHTLPVAPFQEGFLARAEWSVIVGQSGLILSAVIVSAIGLLLSISSLEVAFDQRADVNRDLKVLGLGNAACGVLGGLAGGISISRSVANEAAGAASAAAGVVQAAIVGAAIVWGGPVIALVPKAMLAALLVSIGLGMLKTWVVDSRTRVSGADFLTIVTMVLVTAVFGFLPAVCVGVMICCVDFAVSSARLPPLRRQLLRSAWPTKIEYGPGQLDVVTVAGHNALILELQGVLFFGSVTQLIDHIEQIVSGPKPPRRLLLDFQHVPRVDSSAGQALARQLKEAEVQGLTIDFSGVAPDVKRSLDSIGCAPSRGAEPFRDIDAAVAAWDAEALSGAQGPDAVLEHWLAAELGSRDEASQVLGQFDALRLAPGDVLFAQGDAPDALYLVREGRLTASVQRGSERIEVRTVLAGSALGEMGLFRGLPRSATLTADQPSLVLRLAGERLRRLEAEQPRQAAALHRMLIRQLSARLEQANAAATAQAR